MVVGFPTPGKQVGDFVGGMIGKPGQDVRKPGLRIDVVELGCLCRPPNYAEQSGFPHNSLGCRCTRLGIVPPLAPHSTAEERTMIAEEYLNRSRLFRRLRNGPHGLYVELCASQLVKIGLSRRGTWRSLNLIGDLLNWPARIGSTPTDLNERMVEQYLRRRARKASIFSNEGFARCWCSIATPATQAMPKS